MTEVASMTSETRESRRTKNGLDRTTMGPSAGGQASYCHLTLVN